MTDTLVRRTGSALLWRVSQLGGIKIIYLARLLILARFLAPEDFGLFAMSVITLDLLLKLTDTGMVPALIQQRATHATAYDVAWTVGLVRAALVTATIVAAAPLVGKLFAEPRAATMMQLLAAVALIQGTMSIRMVDLHRELRFRSLAAVYLTEAIVNTVVAVALAPSIGVWALITAPIVAAAVQAGASYVVAPYRPRLVFERDALGHLLAYGRWIFLTSVIAVLGGSLLQLVIARQLGAAELGLYFLAAKLAFLPSSISSEVVGTVAFPVFARFQDDFAKARQAIRSSVLGLAAIVAPASMLLMVMAPALVERLLGARWAGTERLIVILAAVNVIGMIGDVLVPALKGLGQPAAVAITGATQYTLLVPLAWMLTGLVGVAGAALAWLPSVAITQIVGIVLLRRYLHRPLASTLRPVSLILLVSGVAAAAARAASDVLPSPAGLVAALCIGGAVALAGLWLVDRRSGLQLGADLRAIFPQLPSLGRVSSRA
jgi:lipopolysaccharide exporter